MIDIREEIKKYRIEKGLTQKYVANKAGISNKKLSFIENRNVELKTDDFIAIAKGLGVDPSFFTDKVLDNKIKE